MKRLSKLTHDIVMLIIIWVTFIKLKEAIRKQFNITKRLSKIHPLIP